MKFAAVYRSFLLEQPAIGASPADIGTWVRVLAYASERESDTVPMFSTDREWISAAGVSLAEVASAEAAGLLTPVEGGLLVGGFDYEGLRKTEVKRSNGVFGSMGGRPKKPTGFTDDNPEGSEVETPSPSPSLPSPPTPLDTSVRVKRGLKPYPVAFEHLWQAVSHLGGLGNSIKGEAHVAWMQVGQPIENVASRWGDYIGSLPDYQTTPKHFSRWLRARGWQQEYQPATNARPGATGAATAKVEAPRCPPHRDREIPPHWMGSRWAAPGVECVDCRQKIASRRERHVSEESLFAEGK